jgi:hypothetical protein
VLRREGRCSFCFLAKEQDDSLVGRVDGGAEAKDDHEDVEVLGRLADGAGAHVEEGWVAGIVCS